MRLSRRVRVLARGRTGFSVQRSGVGFSVQRQGGFQYHVRMPFSLESLRRQQPDLELSDEPSLLQSHGSDWTRFWPPQPAAVAFPRTTDQVRDLVLWARETGMALVPSGGRTGLSGGAVASHGELVVSFERMRKIGDFDAVDRQLTVEAGATVAAVQQAAAAHGLHYPVSFAAEGSAQIGGSIATNAGGVKVLRYGMTREWVAGLTVVTGTGAVLRLNRGLVKNNAGYDLRHLLVGSEGTLGLICEATLQLTEPPPQQSVLLLGLSGLPALMPVFSAFRDAVRLSAFEFFTDRALERVTAAHDLPPPLDTPCSHYCLLEFDNPADTEQDSAFERFEQLMEAGQVLDGVMSQSGAQAQALWRYREGISESLAPLTPYKNDLAVKPSQVADFLQRLDGIVAQRYPDFEVVWFGHIGDGNLHLNVLKPDAMSVEDFRVACGEVNQAVFGLVQEFGGSISAEHGIGLLKKPYLQHSRSAEEIETLRAIKSVFDPEGLLNPGKLLPADSD